MIDPKTLPYRFLVNFAVFVAAANVLLALSPFVPVDSGLKWARLSLGIGIGVSTFFFWKVTSKSSASALALLLLACFGVELPTAWQARLGIDLAFPRVFFIVSYLIYVVLLPLLAAGLMFFASRQYPRRVE